EFSGDAYLTTAVPFYEFRSVNLQGVLIARIRLSTLNQLLARSRGTQNQDVYFVDSNGQLVARNQQVSSDFDRVISIAEEEGTTVGLAGVDVVFAVEELELGNQQFIMVAERPVSDALAGVQQGFTTAILVMVGALIVAAIMVIGVVYRIVRPVEKLAAAAQ